MHHLFTMLTFGILILCYTKLQADSTVTCHETKGGVYFSVDSRMEALAVVQYLSGCKRIAKDPKEYVAAIDDWFFEYRDHPIIQLWPKLEKRGFNYDTPVMYFLQYDDIPFTQKVNALQKYASDISNDQFKATLGSKVQEREMLALLNDFIVKTRFKDFMTSQERFYKAQIQSAVEALNNANITDAIDSWYGSRLNSYNYVISPLLGMSCYGPCLQNSAGTLDLYCVAAAKTDSQSLLIMLLHEFSHSYVNPLVDEHYNTLKQTKSLRKPIAEKMKAQGYNNWWVTLAEHYVRSATIRLYHSLTDEPSVKYLIESEVKRGFIYTPAINTALEVYETKRESEGTEFDKFFPELVKSMLALKENPREYQNQATRFNGSIGAVYSSNALIIVPEISADSTVSACIMPNAEFVAGRIGARIITDTKAMKLKLSKNPLIVYGCPQNNKWLAKHMAQMRFQLYPDRILADKEYLGADLRIISAQPNPYNPKLGMLIYTAQKPQDLEKINNVHHGPSEFVISNSKGKVLASGFYDD